ncbi:hypothetical protein CspeluHIS016_0801260 [Cutaneotrichosporon spelunceum]|uniref:Uncharacterized protein n=1 Tax=Cutaneotrichosporon spelunceum TaxID=1672016 RepID=A0AAD3TZ19_9TREE|nr:hypothetical protein CspeluHIS016_0801260 [Cutaneotrichosporon spelunceum]
MDDLMAIDTFPPTTIPSLIIQRFPDVEGIPGFSDDVDDLESSLLAMNFLDLDIPIPPSPPQVTLTFPDDWDCGTTIDVAERLAGPPLYIPRYAPETILALESRCRKMIPYLNRSIQRDRLPQFSTLSPSGKTHRQIFTERRKLKTLEYLYAQRLELAHLDAVKSSSPAMWGYITQLTAGISNDSQLWARVNAVRQTLDPNNLTLTFPTDWSCVTVRDVINHLTASPNHSSTAPRGAATKGSSLHLKPGINRDRLPKFSDGLRSHRKCRKLERLVKSQLTAAAFLYGQPLSVAHLNTIERESLALFEFINELGRVVEENEHLDTPIANVLEGFTLANCTSHRTQHAKTTHIVSSTSCLEDQALNWTKPEGELEHIVSFRSKAEGAIPSARLKRKLGTSSSVPNILTNDHSDSETESNSNSKRACHQW